MLKLKLNASGLKYSACFRKLYLTVVEGHRPKAFNNDIEFGIAFHKFAAAVSVPDPKAAFARAIIEAQDYFNTVPKIIKSKKKYLTDMYLAQVCSGWFNAMHLNDDAQILVADDGKALTEIGFEVPFYKSDSLEVNICGTIDKLVRFKQGCIAIGDYKTTSSWNVKEYFESYEMSLQMRLYLWALMQICKTAPADSLFAKILRPESVGIFIDGIFLNGESKQDYKRSPVMQVSTEKVNQFEIMLRDFCRDLDMRISMLAPDSLPEPTGILNDACFGKYGPCHFFGCCNAPAEKLIRPMLKQHFTQEIYDPLRER